MEDNFDKRLKNWIAGEIPGAEVSLTAPEKQPAGQGVGLYLLELAQIPMPSTNRRSPLQLTLRYLVTAWADKPEDAHRTLVQLIFAAMENRDFQVELDPIPITVWTAFGVDPRPSFVLRVPVRKERPEPETPRVREPLRVQSSLVASFHGVVLGPGDIPLAGCRVEVPSLNLATSTDHQGRFRFPGMPATGTKSFLVKAKGRDLRLDSAENHPEGEAPLIIHFSPLEE